MPLIGVRVTLTLPHVPLHGFTLKIAKHCLYKGSIAPLLLLDVRVQGWVQSHIPFHPIKESPYLITTGLAWIEHTGCSQEPSLPGIQVPKTLILYEVEAVEVCVLSLEVKVGPFTIATGYKVEGCVKMFNHLIIYAVSILKD